MHPGGAGRVNSFIGIDGTQKLKRKHGLGYVSFLKQVGDFSGGSSGGTSGGSSPGGSDLFKKLLGILLGGGGGDITSILSGIVGGGSGLSGVLGGGGD